MKSFLVLTFLSLFLLVKSNHNKDDVTFASIVKKFSEKATSDENVHVEHEFDFIIKISDNADSLKSKFDLLVKEFIDNNELKGVIKALPAGQKIDGVFVPVYFNEQFKLINSQRTAKIKDLVHKINTEITIQPHSVKSKGYNYEKLKKSFGEWKQNSKHAELVKNNIQTFEAKNSNLKREFDGEVTEMSQMIESINNSVASVQTSFGKLPQAQTKDDKMAIFREAKPNVAAVSQNQSKLIELLKKTLKTLKSYNEHRIAVAEYLVGVKDSLPAV